jgi:hypothetical protein
MVQWNFYSDILIKDILFSSLTALLKLNWLMENHMLEVYNLMIVVLNNCEPISLIKMMMCITP